mmetsp:Transcript_17438/g.33319  ORF Transcript_17438/g.33319 Transcript_17438/m.33319 type:complete len:297 (-) Transcript_17438:164-1054(-)
MANTPGHSGVPSSHLPIRARHRIRSLCQLARSVAPGAWPQSHVPSTLSPPCWSASVRYSYSSRARSVSPANWYVRARRVEGWLLKKCACMRSTTSRSPSSLYIRASCSHEASKPPTPPVVASTPLRRFPLLNPERGTSPASRSSPVCLMSCSSSSSTPAERFPDRRLAWPRSVALTSQPNWPSSPLPNNSKHTSCKPATNVGLDDVRANSSLSSLCTSSLTAKFAWVSERAFASTGVLGRFPPGTLEPADTWVVKAALHRAVNTSLATTASLGTSRPSGCSSSAMEILMSGSSPVR